MRSCATQARMSSPEGPLAVNGWTREQVEASAAKLPAVAPESSSCFPRGGYPACGKGAGTPMRVALGRLSMAPGEPRGTTHESAMEPKQVHASFCEDPKQRRRLPKGV